MSDPTPEHARLLGLVADYFLAHGVQDVSLSALARAIGSNNRMLLYYFGTKEKLFDEATRAALERFPGIRLLIEDLDAADPSGDVSAILERAWLRIAAPENRPFMKLFFEYFALNARMPAPHAPYLARLSAWKEGVARLLRRHGWDEPTATEAGLAIVGLWRGFQVELIAGTDAAQLLAVHRRALARILAEASDHRPAPAGRDAVRPRGTEAAEPAAAE